MAGTARSHAATDSHSVVIHARTCWLNISLVRTKYGVCVCSLVLEGSDLIYISRFSSADAIQNPRFEPVAKLAYVEKRKEPSMITQDIQPSPAIADQMSYWLLATLMTFGLLGAVLLPVAALVLR